MKYRLEDLFELQMGKTPSRNNPEYWKTTGHKWISIADLSKCGKYIRTTKEYLSDLALEESGISQIPENTVIMSFKLSIGKTAITDEKMYSNEAIMSFLDRHVVELLPEYIYYLLSARNWDNGTNKAVMGKTLNKATLSKVEVNIHAFEEQKRIVENLNKISSIIEARQQELKMLDELVKARFVEMFGDPVNNPKGWDKEELSQCLTSIDNGKSFVCEANSRIGDEPAVLKLSAVTYGYYKPEENKAMINAEQFVENAEVHSGDLLFTRKNTPELVGMSVYIYDTPAKLMMPDLIFRLNVSERCNKIFLWKLINHDLFRPCIENIATGSAKSMSNISKERLLRLKIILPPMELQQQFAAFVSEVDKSKIMRRLYIQLLGTITTHTTCNFTLPHANFHENAKKLQK